MTDENSTNPDEPRLPLGKPCNKCGEWKLYEEFSRHKKTKDGLQFKCKDCVREYNKAYRAKNAERLAEYDRKRYEQDRQRCLEYQRKRRQEKAEEIAEYQQRYRQQNKEKIAEFLRRWREANKDRLAAEKHFYYEANKERIAQYQRHYREENKESIAEYKRRHRQENRERYAELKQRRRALEIDAEGYFSAAEFKNLCAQYGDKCLCCGATKPLEPDHVVPLVRGGSNDIVNIQPLCRTCNARKGAKTIDYR